MKRVFCIMHNVRPSITVIITGTSAFPLSVRARHAITRLFVFLALLQNDGREYDSSFDSPPPFLFSECSSSNGIG